MHHPHAEPSPPENRTEPSAPNTRQLIAIKNSHFFAAARARRARKAREYLKMNIYRENIALAFVFFRNEAYNDNVGRPFVRVRERDVGWCINCKIYKTLPYHFRNCERWFIFFAAAKVWFHRSRFVGMLLCIMYKFYTMYLYLYPPFVRHAIDS